MATYSEQKIEERRQKNLLSTQIELKTGGFLSRIGHKYDIDGE